MKKLPSRPNLEQLKKQAKAFLKDKKASSARPLKLSEAQRAIANEYGFKNWAALKAHVLQSQDEPLTDADVRALREAISKDDLPGVAALLDARPDLVNERGGSGIRTGLHDAAARGNEAIVKLLLDRGADPNIRCEGDNAFPLHFAAEKGRFGTIRLLIEQGADPIGEGDYHELEVIGWATSWEYIQANREIVDYLLAHGARHNIFSAVSMGEVEVIRRLVAESRANLEKRMDWGNKRRRPLHLSVMKKQPAALTTLLDLGANTESLDEAGFTALDQAAIRGATEMAQLLLDRGAKVRLPAAIALGRSKDVERLLRREPDGLKPGNRWGDLIVRASEQSPGHVVESLIRAGASVNVRDDPKTSVDSTSGYTPLHGAGFFGNKEAAAVLLRHGADVRARDERYRGTPAGWASYAGHTEVRDMIHQGPIDIIEAVDAGLARRLAGILDREPEVLNRPFHEFASYPVYAEGWYTPLAFAVVRGDAETARVLLEYGADPAIHAPDGRALIEIAREKGNQQIIDLLSREGNTIEEKP